ncbi:Alpha/Beta hydrolase protein [Dactylonectria macrodidyma]|uniref:Kynurenine formamidase n=1 Tax=Dactylonectria macrodidyma TaxID=307937 RepID=A0A9P9DES7_9HYPO|nr:Alpha/Beta hydrolase protein [Dactylonectria macrodidyma]
MASSEAMQKLLTYTCHQYGDHDLQRVGIWRRATPQNHGRWVIFIHGGAWRDPRNTLENFIPSIQQIVSSPDEIQSQVCGFASIDYRLSPTSRSHPDHVLDVRAALKFLLAQIQLTDNYVLIGHSAGATLAYQVVMGEAALSGQPVPDEIPLPAAIVGVSGIYELVGLKSRHSHIEAYSSFISGAFGSEGSNWVKASPASYEGNLRHGWSGYSLLAYSPEDSLIDNPEIDSMATKLSLDGLEFDVVKDLKGDHNLVWQEGSQIARLVAQVLRHIRDD